MCLSSYLCSYTLFIIIVISPQWGVKCLVFCICKSSMEEGWTIYYYHYSCSLIHVWLCYCSSGPLLSILSKLWHELINKVIPYFLKVFHFSFQVGDLLKWKWKISKGWFLLNIYFLPAEREKEHKEQKTKLFQTIQITARQWWLLS